MPIRIIDRYLITEVFRPFMGGIIFSSFLFLMFQFLNLADFLILHGVPLHHLFKIIQYLLVTFLPLGLPVSILFGVMAAFGRLSTDSEIVAMKASGLSLFRIAVPILGFSSLIAVFALFLNLNWAPGSETAMRQLLIRLGNAKFTNSIQEGTFTTGFMGLLIYTEKVNSRAGKMEKVFIYDERDPTRPSTVIAKSGELIRVQLNEEQVQGAILQLQDGAIHQSAIGASEYFRANFSVYQIYADLSAGSAGFAIKPRMHSLEELLKRRNQADNPSQERRVLDTEIWRRASVLLMPAVFVLLGIGFGTVRTRGSRAGVLLVSLIAMAAYWQLQVSGIWLGDQGYLPPWLAVQLPNAALGIVGFFAFRRASW